MPRSLKNRSAFFVSLHFFVPKICIFILFISPWFFTSSLQQVIFFRILSKSCRNISISFDLLRQDIKFTVEKCHSPLACETFLAFLLFHHIKQTHLLHLKVRQYHPFRLLALHMGHIHSLYSVSDAGLNKLQYIDIVKPIIDGIAA